MPLARFLRYLVGSGTKAGAEEASCLAVTPRAPRAPVEHVAEKTALLRGRLLGSPSTLRLVVDRSEALAACTAEIDRLDQPMILAPYFKSPFGKKIEQQQTVEEGEGNF
jgi:hypothetical protein